MSSASRKRREAAERQERAEAAGLVCHVCNRPAKRVCASCQRRACAAHSRAPWDGPWLCSACEEQHGAPPRPPDHADRHLRAGRHGAEFHVEVIERRPRR